MFGLGLPEMLIILLLALFVVGGVAVVLALLFRK